MFRLVQRHGGDAHIGAVEFLEDLDQLVVFGDRRRQDDAGQFLTLDEVADVLARKSGLSAARMHQQFEAGAADHVENALLHVDDVLRVRLVVDQADEEGALGGEAARHRIGRVADLLDQRLDPLARVLLHERRLVDDARDGLLRHAREAGHIVDGGAAAVELEFFRLRAFWLAGHVP